MTTETRLTLYQLEQDVKEEIDERIKDAGLLGEKYPEDTLAEIADGAIPVYYADLLAVAANDPGPLAIRVPEVWAFGGEHNAVNAIAGNLYDHLYQVASEYFEEQKREATSWDCCCPTCGDPMRDVDDDDQPMWYCDNCQRYEEVTE
jgi:hypothetical protein